MNAQRVKRVITLLFFNLGARWGGLSTLGPGCFTSKKKTQFPLYRGLGRPQGAE